MDQTTFDTLSAYWQDDMSHRLDSTGQECFRNPAFQFLIDTGPSIIPLIFQRYGTTPDWGWSAMLEEITGEAPYRKTSPGRYDAIKKDWINWYNKQKREKVN